MSTDWANFIQTPLLRFLSKFRGKYFAKWISPGIPWMNRFLSISKSNKVLTNYYSSSEILLLKICLTTIIAEDEPLVYLNQTIPCKNCPFQLMSGNGQADEMDQLNLDYRVSVTIDQLDKPPRHLLLRIKLTRLTKRSFVEYVFPTGVLVIVSWVRSAFCSPIY